MALVTDGTVTFAIFNYADPGETVGANPTVGFYGNRRQFSNVDILSLEMSNVFRIDGM